MFTTPWRWWDRIQATFLLSSLLPKNFKIWLIWDKFSKSIFELQSLNFCPLCKHLWYSLGLNCFYGGIFLSMLKNKGEKLLLTENKWGIYLIWHYWIWVMLQEKLFQSLSSITHEGLMQKVIIFKYCGELSLF